METDEGPQVQGMGLGGSSGKYSTNLKQGRETYPVFKLLFVHQALENSCRTDGGYSGIRNVYQVAETASDDVRNSSPSPVLPLFNALSCCHVRHAIFICLLKCLTHCIIVVHTIYLINIYLWKLSTEPETYHRKRKRDFLQNSGEICAQE